MGNFVLHRILNNVERQFKLTYLGVWVQARDALNIPQHRFHHKQRSSQNINCAKIRSSHLKNIYIGNIYSCLENIPPLIQHFTILPKILKRNAFVIIFQSSNPNMCNRSLSFFCFFAKLMSVNEISFCFHKLLLSLRKFLSFEHHFNLSIIVI